MAKQFSVFVNIGGKVGNSFSNAINTVEGRLNALSRHFAKSAAGARAALKSIGESMKGVVALAAGGGLTLGFKHAIGDGAEFLHEAQGLRNAGRSVHEVAEGIAAATAAIEKLPTATLTNGLKILNETTGAFGDYHHALENLEFNSKLGDVLKNTLGIEDPTHAIGSLIKALEIRGSASNPAQYRREAEKLTQAMTFFGGRLKADDFYTFASNAQVGIRQLNERFLTRIAPSLIQELGGDKTGTGLTAFRTIIGGRKLSDNAQAKAWVDLGLVDKKNLIHNKQGDVKGWKDGAVFNTKLAYQDPLQFMEDVILPKLQKNGSDITDPIKLGQALNTLFKNTRANSFVTAISAVVDRRRLKTNEGFIEQALSVDDNYNESLLNDPKVAQYAIKSAMTNIGTALTTPVLKPVAQMLISIARAINKVSAALMRNPAAAKIVTGLATAFSALAAVRIASFLLGITGLGRALGLIFMAIPLGAAARVMAFARAMKFLAVAATFGLASRLRAIAVGLFALTTATGAKAAVAGLGRALLAVLVPMALFRAGLRLVKLAMIGTGIGVAFLALGAAAKFMYDNWEGMGKGLTAFSAAFQKALPPDIAERVKPLIDGLTKLFGEGGIKYDNAQWEAWGNQFGTLFGTKVGEWAAKIGELSDSLERLKNFNLKWSDLVKLDEATGSDFVGQWTTTFIEAIKSTAKQGYEALVTFDWGAAGKALMGKLAAGIGDAAGVLADALKSAASAAWEKAKSAIGFGGSSSGSSAPSGVPLQGKARGGPVSGGKTYLVGEHGPELFRSAGAGRIETNRTLNNLAERMNGPKPEPGGGGKSWYDAVMRAEGTSGRDPYNTVLGYGRYGSPSKPLTDMSLSEAYQFGRSVRARHGSSSALGAFQIVGRTMKDAMKATGLGWGDKFSPENQRSMADWIRRKQGFGAWEGFKRHPGELAAARAGGSAVDPTEGPSATVGKIIRDAQEGAARHAAAAGDEGGSGNPLASRVAAIVGRAQSASGGTEARSKSTSKGTGGIVVNVTVNSSSSDPHEIARIVDQRLRMTLAQYESDQRRALSD